MMCETSQTSFLPHPSRAPFSKFSLTFAHTYNSAFNIPFSSFQLCAMRFLRFRMPVSGSRECRICAVVLRNGPFQGAKRAISEGDMGHIGARNGLYWSAKWGISRDGRLEDEMEYCVNG